MPYSNGSSMIYTIVPADLTAAEQGVLRCEQEWQRAGAVWVSEPQLDQALRNAKDLQDKFRQAKKQSHPSLSLVYLRLVRLFVLTGLPRFGEVVAISVAAVVLC